MKAKELAEILMKNPEMEVVTSSSYLSDLRTAISVDLGNHSMYTFDFSVKTIKGFRIPKENPQNEDIFFKPFSPLDGEELIEVISLK